MANCSSCGKAAPEGSRFCPFCGGRIVVERQKPADPLIGKIIGDKYIVKDLIGSGAMGSIYRAEHKDLSRPVALKVLHRHLLTDEGQVHRFHREAKAASRLHHPNAIGILDFGRTVDGWFYIAMEYLNGKDLSRMANKEGAMPVEKVIHIARQVLDALDEAHASNVVHRDLKPENIMVEPLRSDPLFVKVLDFGIAKIRDTDGSDASGFKTATGMVFGTPEYMSPEQIRGDELDGRSDLYSLGIVMYQMLTGQLPFTGETVIEIATAHLINPVPNMRPIRPDIPEKMIRLVEKLIEKKRENRFQTAEETRKCLDDVADLLRRKKDELKNGLDAAVLDGGGASGLDMRTADTITTTSINLGGGMLHLTYPVVAAVAMGLILIGGGFAWALSLFLH
ncbi:MAG TPA: serine/threonine-protein kinase [Myxococcota bacterium]|nr:serine/threonine-protein kinase [Myxococcota bacterium]HOA14509.1 serine/threonine-protein kinase [Myxococcota bacterium]HOH77816.1 serine/threonine-protein kinase [Myxococcota bacterium]HPV04520.1 serine/threonine-protein kinase [Myxococcota bacterium]